PRSDAIFLDGIRGVLSRSLNSCPVARKARECAVEHRTLPGNRFFASFAVALLNAIYIPRLPTTRPIASRVLVLPVPAPAIRASRAPPPNASRAAACSCVSSTNAPPSPAHFPPVVHYTAISGSGESRTG